jgi:hypothetical protein
MREHMLESSCTSKCRCASLTRRTRGFAATTARKPDQKLWDAGKAGWTLRRSCPGPLKKLEKQGVPWFAASFLRLARNLTKLEANCILQCTSIGQIDRKIGQA